MKVAVLKGGISAERAVSLVSGEACAKALTSEGFDVVEIDAHPNTLMERLRQENPDVIFNALHGDWGEDGEVQTILEAYGRPYTHSGVEASSLAMNKHEAKKIFVEQGIRVPQGQIVRRITLTEGGALPVPYVVKPNGSGSSTSVYIVLDETPEILAQMAEDEGLGEKPIIEPFIPGRELTVSVLDGRAICVTEIVPQGDWYDYDAKYADGGSRHIVDVDLPLELTEAALKQAEAAHIALGCRGVTRADFRLDDTNWEKNASEADVVNGLVMLEVNTQPGMTPTSLVPEQCQHIGMSFGSLCRWMVEDASCPRETKKTPRK